MIGTILRSILKFTHDIKGETIVLCLTSITGDFTCHGEGITFEMLTRKVEKIK
jgi:hypothetical protein